MNTQKRVMKSWDETRVNRKGNRVRMKKVRDNKQARRAEALKRRNRESKSNEKNRQRGS